jgi:hypothetical protein
VGRYVTKPTTMESQAGYFHAAYPREKGPASVGSVA